MKKMIYILPLLFVALFSACEVESGDSSYPRTLQGKIAFNEVEGRLSQCVSLLDLMTKVDYYGQAPIDEKEGIKNYFLRDYVITNTEDTWTLKDDYKEMVFTHNKKSLNESGAIWTIKVTIKLWDGETITMIKEQNFRVESMGDKDWRIKTYDLKLFSPTHGYSYPTENVCNSELSVKGVKAYDKSPNLYDFKIEEGKGSLNMNKTNIGFQLLQPASYSYSTSTSLNLIISSGELDITADKDKIKAKVIASGYYPVVEITLNGLTETY
ncbi:MAG: hypothetical protein E6772_10340 [Dysgonomonas sp.]|nr:hypothetical protein [Dysgonomonas sp.]